MTFHRGYSEYDEDVALHRFLTRSDARRKAKRYFVYAAVIFGVLGFAAGAAWSDTISISGTMVSLEPSQEPGVVAIVTMENVALNGEADNGSYWLTMPGLTVEAVFLWEAGSWGQDSITVIPPDGMRCEPASCEASVLEGLTGHVLLLDWVGS